MPADAASTDVQAAPPLQAALAVGAMMAVQALATMAVLSLAAVAPEVGRALDLPPSLIGYQISLIYAGAMASSVFGGGLPQRWGAVAGSQAALALCAAGALLAVLPSLAALALGSFVIGLCYGLTNPAASLLMARIAVGRNRNLIFSLKQTGVPLGGVAAGLIAPAAALAWDWRAAPLVVALGALVLLAALQPLRRRWDSEGSRTARNAFSPTGNLALALRDPGLRRLAVIAFCYGANQLCLMTFAVTLLVVERGVGLAEAGAALALIQVSGACARLAWGAVADWMGDGFRVLAVIALVMIPAALALALIGPDWPRPLLWLALFVYAVSAIGWNGVFTAELVRRAPAGQIGAATGGVMFFAFFGVLVGPAGFAAAYSVVGSYGATYGLLAIVAAAGLAAAWSGRRR